MAEHSWMADLYGELGDAVADIRQKVVEEGYFGRAVTQLDMDAPQWPESTEPELGAQEPAQNIEQEHSPDLDIDR